MPSMIYLSIPWQSLGPLLLFNALLLGTVIAFRPIYRRRLRDHSLEERHASSFLNKWMREYWYWLTEPFVRFFIKLRMTPNRLTVFGVLISAVSGYFFWQGHFGLGGWLMIIAGTFDTFDGRVARATNRESVSGAYLDAVMDRVSEGMGFLGLALYYQGSWILWVVIAAFMGAYMVSYSRAKGEAEGARYSGGSMQRPERVVYLGVGAIFAPIFGWIVNLFYPAFDFDLYILPLGFVALMTWVTSYNRIQTVMRMLDEKSDKV